MLSGRKQNLFQAIVEEYLETARAVGSHLLVHKYGFNFSPATIRHEMLELEEEGYLTHPHPSAGRIPTEKGYRYYIDHLLEEPMLPESNKAYLTRSIRSHERNFSPENVRQLAKALAELSKEAVIVGFDRYDTYYTGLGNLFRQPEFMEFRFLDQFSDVVDRLDEGIEDIFDEINDDVRILLGEESPFGKEWSIVVTKYESSRSHGSLLGILGPIRMDYGSSRVLIRFARGLMGSLAAL